MAKKIGIIGNGNVGSALASGLEKAGHEIRAVGNDSEAIRGAVGWAEVVLLAVPFGALEEVIETAGDLLDGMTVVDVTNVLDAEMNLAVGFTTSGAEILQERIPSSQVVKAFNTVFAQHMATGSVEGKRLSALVAGDDDDAKATVIGLARDIGFDPVDAGPLANARLLEPLGYLNIQLGYVLGMGTQIGFQLVHS